MGQDGEGWNETQHDKRILRRGDSVKSEVMKPAPGWKITMHGKIRNCVFISLDGKFFGILSHVKNTQRCGSERGREVRFYKGWNRNDVNVIPCFSLLRFSNYKTLCTNFRHILYCFVIS